jgi:hypothetical protein
MDADVEMLSDQAYVRLGKGFADHSLLLNDLRAKYPLAAPHDGPPFRDLLKRMKEWPVQPPDRPLSIRPAASRRIVPPVTSSTEVLDEHDVADDLIRLRVQNPAAVG